MNIPDLPEREEAAARYAALQKAEDDEYEAPKGTEGDAALEKAVEDARSAYDAMGRCIATNDDGKVLRCAISNAPLWDDETDDEIALVLRSVIAAMKPMEVA